MNESHDLMNESKIKDFLNSWTKGVIEIGKAYSKKEDFEKEALKFLSKHYAFKTQQILFKPTFTKEKIFRNNLEDALSYFVKGKFSEDNGFALKPWEEINLQKLWNMFVDLSLTSHSYNLILRKIK